MQTWILPAVAGVATTYYTLAGQNEKRLRKLGLGKINKKWGIAISGILFFASYMAWKGGQKRLSMLIDTSPPNINQPGVQSGFTSGAFSGRQPLGYLTGVGREQHKAEVPASSLSNFPY